jgi:hypothetical protein
VAASMTDNATKVANVIARIESGESENAACAAEGIARSTFRTTALRHGAGDSYARALFGLAHDQAEKLEQTIQDMRAGTLDPAIGRIEVDARKWFASKFLPKQYGDKTQTEISGPDGGPVSVTWLKPE